MMPNLNSLDKALLQIKTLIEKAIRDKGTAGKNSLIRSQKPIKLLHEVVKSELIRNNVDPALITPSLGTSYGELSLAGFFKRKDQDICVTPKDLQPKEEVLNFEGILNGEIDRFGKAFTEKTLSINVRSQLSSSAKNFDTLYERTFAEALNLHLRCPKMVLGEFYMIPVREYDSNASNKKKIGFRKIKGIEKHIEKYILSFNAVNERESTDGEHFKYEKVCLLIIDFSAKQPRVYSHDEELAESLLLPENSKASIMKLNFESFVPDLLNSHSTRFGRAISI